MLPRESGLVWLAWIVAASATLSFLAFALTGFRQ